MSEAEEGVELRANRAVQGEAGERVSSGGHSYRRLSPLTPVARSGIILVAAVAATWRDLVQRDFGATWWLLMALLAVGAIYGVASWLRTKYWIEADELRVDTGVISRQSRRIRIDRLQGVDIVQPFIARLLGLAELRMDVAGGGRREGSLAFLRLADARELQALLLARRDVVRRHGSEPPATSGTSTDATGEVPEAPPLRPDRVLAKVELGLLLQSTLLTTETLALVGVLVVLGISIPFEVAFATGLLPAAGGLIVVLYRKVVGSWKFTVTDTDGGLKISRGLFELTSQTIALHRLQGLVVREPVLWRRLGWARLDVSIAGYDGASGNDDSGPSVSTVLPVGDRRLVLWLAHLMLGGVDPDHTELSLPPERARWVSPIGRHFAGAGASEHVIASRRGWLVRRTHVVPHARVQSLRLTQGPVQRRLGLADVHVDSPPGPARVRATDRLATDARTLLDQEIRSGRAARLVPPTRQGFPLEPSRSPETSTARPENPGGSAESPDIR